MSSSPQGLEMWSGGLVRSGNIGPAGGDRLLGKIEDPGLYMFVGPNTGGKSHHLRLLGKLQEKRLLRSDADITDGESAAFLEFALARVTFRRLPTGEVQEPVREGIETLPKIESLPSAIQTLIDGGNLRGEEPRARARLEALLTYAPVASTDEAVRALCECLDGKVIEDEPAVARVERWMELRQELADGPSGRRLKLEPFRTAEEILAWLLAQPREGILEDHSRLLNLLNGAANTAEKLHELQARRAAEAGGRVKGTLTAQASRLNRADEAALGAELRARPLEQAPDLQALTEARVALAKLQAAVAAQQQETERRQAIAASHGAKPDPGPARERARQAANCVAAAEAEVQARRAAHAKAEQSADEAMERSREVQAENQRLYAEWDEASDDFASHFGGADGPAFPSDPDTLKLAAGAMRRATDRLLAHTEERARHVRAAQGADQKIEAAQEAMRAAEDDATDQRRRLATAEAEATTAEAAARSWEETQDLLASPVPGPTLGELDDAAVTVRTLEDDARLHSAALAYGLVLAVHGEEQAMSGWFSTVAADLRKAATESWAKLGTVVTAALDLPWLMVAGLRILLVYDGTGTGAKLATSAENAIDVRDLDDTDRVSTAELHEAMLRLMLARREQLGGILIVPDETLHPLDGERLRVFSGWARDAGLFVISERPRRGTDPADLHLEYVKPAGPQ